MSAVFQPPTPRSGPRRPYRPPLVVINVEAQSMARYARALVAPGVEKYNVARCYMGLLDAPGEPCPPLGDDEWRRLIESFRQTGELT